MSGSLKYAMKAMKLLALLAVSSYIVSKHTHTGNDISLRCCVHVDPLLPTDNDVTERLFSDSSMADRCHVQVILKSTLVLLCVTAEVIPKYKIFLDISFCAFRQCVTLRESSLPSETHLFRFLVRT